MSSSSSQGTWADNAKTDWFNTVFLTFLPIAAIVSLGFYFYLETFNWWMIAVFFFFYFAAGLSITAGYHRLFAHKGYEAHPIVQFLYLFFGAGAFENSALKWCTDHRVHHVHCDKDDDPYNIGRGFWYAHIGWICKDGNPKDFSYLARDLVENKLVQWQYRNYMWVGITSGVILPTLMGWAFGSALGGLAFGGFLRICVVHHVTFFINSAAHVWGKQTFTDRNTAKDNFFLAFLTYGEGYHNFHHLFANDYRNGIRWFDFDPTKWTIKSLEIVGLASKLKVTPQIQIIRAKMAMKKKALESKIASENYRQQVAARMEELKAKVEEAYQNWGEIRERYRQEYQVFKSEKTLVAREKLEEMKRDIRLAKAEYREAWHLWKEYSKTALALDPAVASI